MPEAVARPQGTVRAIRFFLRTALLLPHVVAGLMLAVAVRIEGGKRLRPEPLMRWWSRRTLGILGIEMKLSGRPAPGGHLVVANHVSWLDISVLSACLPVRFISKAEVRRWPVAGMLATASGTFYLRRGKGGSRPLLKRLVPFLREGGSVVLYPEGTTSSGDDVLPFHARLFAAAIESGVPVQPVALQYGRGDGGTAVAPFVGDDGLLPHLLRLMLNRRLVVRIAFCEEIPVDGRTREALADAAYERIRAAIRPGDRDREPAFDPDVASAPQPGRPIAA